MIRNLLTLFAPFLLLTCVTCSSLATIKRTTSSLLPSYDYIIAGGGTSGLTVADRLTAAFPDRTVLVVEYGQLINSTDVLTPAATVPNRNYAFQILSQPEPGLNNRSFTVTVGKLVGGCSAINAQMFDRGSRADYDAWGDVAGKEYKDSGWSWDGLLPYFRKSTTFTPPSAAVSEKYGYTYDIEAAYGGNGSIHASYPPFQWPTESEQVAVYSALHTDDLAELVRSAWKELGAPTPKEGASGDAVGVFWLPSSQDPKTQTRSYARTGHYDPVASRQNYHLLVGHKVTEVIIQETGSSERSWEANGVTIQTAEGRDTSAVSIESGHDVILAAGAIHTPGILQRSGLGSRDVLNAVNVSIKVELPGVGQNFQDHALLNMFYNMATPLPGPEQLFMNRSSMQEAQRQYAENKTGPLTLSGGNSAAFLPLSLLAQNISSILTAVGAQSPSTYLPPKTHDTVIKGYKHQITSLTSQLSSNSAAVFEYPIGYGNMISFLKPLSRGSVNIYGDDNLREAWLGLGE
ncbi:Nn.00g100450.m01.CDS01 [Neocucurbitaria sp. VM-36]